LVDEQWPQFNGHNLAPLISIYIPDLQFVPAGLEGIQLINVFVYKGKWDWQDENKGAILFRSYLNIDSLIELEHPSDIPNDEIQINWEPRIDYPEAYSLTSEEEFDEYCKYEVELEELFPQQREIKVGGYPYFIQGYHDSPDYVFQWAWKMASPFNKVYMFGDGGVAHFQKNGKEWKTYWECS
jgi:hypothetical protein